jgi:hypothetical protein
VTNPGKGSVRLAAVLATVLAALATSVAPAGAKPRINQQAFQVCSSWNVAGASTFGALARLAPAASTSRAAGSKGREPADRSGLAGSTEISSGTKINQFPGATIGIYYHVVTNGAAGQVSNATIAAQTQVMNLSFSGFYGGVDTGFRFRTAGVDRTDNAAWYTQATFDDEVSMKGALKTAGDATALNVYTTSGGDFLGWAYYPSIVHTQFKVLDGIVIDYRSMPGGAYGTNYSLGYTLTHETGHWLGLAHTFEKGCIGAGDHVSDTPEEAEPTSGCPTGKDTCTTPGFDPIHNYMDYSYDSCYDQFTAGQADRMGKQYMHWRVQQGYNSPGA